MPKNVKIIKTVLQLLKHSTAKHPQKYGFQLNADCDNSKLESKNRCRILTGGKTRIWVGSVPAGCRGAAPHAVLVRRQVAHVAQVAVTVAPHGRVWQLRNTCRSHVVSRRHSPIMAHVVLLHRRLWDLRLPVRSERCPQVVILHTYFLIALLKGTQDIGNRKRSRMLRAHRHCSGAGEGEIRRQGNLSFCLFFFFFFGQSPSASCCLNVDPGRWTRKRAPQVRLNWIEWELGAGFGLF